MPALGLILILVGFVGLITGVVTLAHPIHQLRIPTRKIATIVAATSLAVMILGGALVPARGAAQPSESGSTTTASANATPTPPRARRIRPLRLVGRAAIAVAHLIPGVK